MIKNNTYKYISGNNSILEFDLKMPKHINFNYVNILDFKADYSFYMINEGYNFFIITEDNNDYLIELEIGNYTSIALINELKTKLNNIGNYLYDVYLETNTNKIQNGKILFTTTNNGYTSFKFSNDINNKIYKLMGFNYNSENIFNNNILISSNVVDFSIVEEIRIHCDFLSDYNDDILDIINIGNYSSYSKIEYKNNRCDYTKKKIININNIDKIKIFITDENNKLINFNNGSINLTLLFYTELSFDFLKEYIRLKLINDNN